MIELLLYVGACWLVGRIAVYALRRLRSHVGDPASVYEIERRH